MSLSVCTSCLARLRIAKTTPSTLAIVSRPPSSASPFHSSAIQQNVVKKKTTQVPGVRPSKLRQSQSARIKNKKKERARPPPVGQRKAERKRIVLSNTNALEVKGLQKLSVESMADASKIGTVMTLDGPLLDQLREAKAFKTTQNWSLFRSPSTFVRSETIEMGADIEDVAEGKRTVRRVVTGEKGCGKSVHLLQGMSLAYLNKWVVINIPDCQEYVINQSAYTPVPKGETGTEQMYNQPQLAADILTRVAHSNSDVLSKLKPVHEHGKTIAARKPKSLKDLASIGAEDTTLAPRVWNALWKELTVPAEGSSSKDTTRPPVLIAIDGINFWMAQTKYRSPDYKFIHAHQFTLVKQFLDLMFSKEENVLPNGGMVLACTTKSSPPITPAFDLLVRQIQARQSGMEITDSKFPLGDPYMKQADSRVASLLSGVEHTSLTTLKGLTRLESKSLLEYFAKSGVFREQVSDAAVAEKWTMSGGGIVGELCKLGKRTRTSIFDTGSSEGIKMRT